MKKLFFAAALTAVVALGSFSGVTAAQGSARKGCANAILLEYLASYSEGSYNEGTDPQVVEETFQNRGSQVCAFVQSLKESGYLEQYNAQNQTRLNFGGMVSAYVHMLKENGGGRNNGAGGQAEECVQTGECVQNEECPQTKQHVRNGNGGNSNGNAGQSNGNGNNKNK